MMCIIQTPSWRPPHGPTPAPGRHSESSSPPQPPTPVYVMFNAAVSRHRRHMEQPLVPRLLLRRHQLHKKMGLRVCFAAAGSWIGAYLSMTFLRRTKPPTTPQAT